MLNNKKYIIMFLLFGKKSDIYFASILSCK